MATQSTSTEGPKALAKKFDLTDAQREQLADAKRAVPTIAQLLARLPGVGKKVVETVLAETTSNGDAKASKEIRDRANAAPTEKAGLRGKALALYVLTGKSNGGEDKPKIESLADALLAADKAAKNKPAKPAAAKPDAIEAKAGRELLVAYLKAETSNADDALAKAAPTVTDGKLRVKAWTFQAYLAKTLGRDVSRREATAILKDAGLVSQNWNALPQGARVVYAGDVPAGAGKLPQRKGDAGPTK